MKSPKVVWLGVLCWMCGFLIGAASLFLNDGERHAVAVAALSVSVAGWSIAVCSGWCQLNVCRSGRENRKFKEPPATRRPGQVL